MAEAGVYSRNLFDLLDDENRDTSAQAAAAKPAKDAKKEAAKPAPAPAAPAKKDDSRARPDQNKIRSGYPGRGGARGGRAAAGEGNGPSKNVPPRLARQGGEGAEAGMDVTEAKEERAARRERGERTGRGGARGRGGRGGFGNRAPRHEYDRHGNIEHADSDKKDAAGKGSWGAPGVEVEDIEKAQVDGEAKEPAEPTPEELERQAAEKAAEEERRRQEEEEAKLMTLEQYQAAQAAKRAAAAAAAPARKANEGVDESQWKTKKFERKEGDDVYFAGKGTTKAVKEKTKKVKETVELEMRFSDEQRQRPAGRGGRGGRGGAAPSRGGARGGRSNGPAPALEDTNAFPSLTKA